MKKTLQLLVILFINIGFSQVPAEKINTYLRANTSKLGLTADDINHWRVESFGNSKTTGIDNYYIVQQVNGVDVKNSISNVWYKNGAVINIQNAFIQNAKNKINTSTPNLNIEQAFLKALGELGEMPFSIQVIENKGNNKFVLSNGNLSEDPINANLVFQPVNNNEELKLAWSFEFYTQDYKHLWNLSVDANSGKIIEIFDGVLTCNFGDSNHQNHNHDAFFSPKLFREQKNSLVDIQSGSYRVLHFETESPNHGSRVLISNPENLNASPYGWHDVNGTAGAEYTITRGNNVLAQEDIDGNNGSGASPNGGASLLFDFPYGGVGVAPATYTDAATTNLFYMNNIMHDIWYEYGFNEVNGNFQQNNYGNGGVTTFTGDYVFADAQDGSGTNNANFSTPSDGNKPRMQMYLWDAGPRPKYLTINSPAGIAGDYYAANQAFTTGGVPIPLAPGLTRDFVLYLDAVGGTTEGCGTTPPLNAAAMVDKVVVIRRGNCPFVEKVKNAQDQGAAAVIVVNNDTANPDQLIGMAGDDASIVIPAIFVSYNVGEALISQMLTTTVNGTIINEPTGFVNSDGDFDNGVIAHEYGHGISTRLTGGPTTSCLNSSEQMGEGWSDFFALMLQMKNGDSSDEVRGIATFLVSQPINGTGIREYPYTTDMNINPFTFGDTNGMWYTDTNGVDRVDVHSVGSVWATMLWDLAWAYVDKYGFDADKYNGNGGNNKVMQLVIDGLKLQGCSPSFISGRDALIAADQATTGGQDYCLIWEVFARRGLGANASSGTNSGIAGINDQVEDFTVPPAGPNCTLSVDYFENQDGIKVYPNPSNGNLNIAILKYNGEINFELFDLNGRKVFGRKVDNFSTELNLNLEGIQSGVYLLKAQGQDLSFTRKIILN